MNCYYLRLCTACIPGTVSSLFLTLEELIAEGTASMKTARMSIEIGKVATSTGTLHIHVAIGSAIVQSGMKKITIDAANTPETKG